MLYFNIDNILNLLIKPSTTQLYGNGIYRTRNVTIDKNYHIDFENFFDSIVCIEPKIDDEKYINYLNKVIKDQQTKLLFTKENADYLDYYLLLTKNENGSFIETLLYSYESINLQNLNDVKPETYLWVNEDGYLFTPGNINDMQQLKNQVEYIRKKNHTNEQQFLNYLNTLKEELNRRNEWEKIEFSNEPWH